MTIECTQCHHKNPDDTEFCENCGAQLNLAAAVAGMNPVVATPPVAPAKAPDTLVCPNCKAPYTQGDIFCFNCGFDLTKLPAVPVAAQPPLQATAQQPAAQPTGNGQPSMSPDDFDALLASGKPVPAMPPTIPVSGQNPAVTPPQPQTPPPALQPDPPVASGFNAVAPVQPAIATAPGKLALNVFGPYGVDTVEYKGKELLLGRQDIKTRVFPDVNLDDGASSRRHLSMWLDELDGHFYAQDLESSNGSALNGRDMEPGAPTQLHNGDVIKIGTRYSIQVRIS